MPGEGSTYQLTTRTVVDGKVKVRKRWVAQLSVGPRGARVLTRRYCPWDDNTKRRATELLAGILAETKAEDQTTTLGDYLPKWRDRYAARSKVGPSQAANARGIVTMHLLTVLRDVRLVDVRPSTVEAVLARTSAARSPSTTRHVYNVLAVALEDARKEGLLTTNPAREVDRPTVPKTRKPPWSLGQVQRFLEAADTDEYRALFILAAATGLRQGELLGLSWTDVDLDAASVTVNLQLQRRPDPKRPTRKMYARVPRKGDGEAYTVELPALAVEALREHRDRMPSTLDGGLVFVTERGRPVSGSVVTHRLQRIAEAAGLPRQDFHGLRRFRASLGPLLHIDPKVQQGQLGHADIATTLGIYTYTDPAQARAAASLVDEALRRVG
jgi:integrase